MKYPDNCALKTFILSNMWRHRHISGLKATFSYWTLVPLLQSLYSSPSTTVPLLQSLCYSPSTTVPLIQSLCYSPSTTVPLLQSLYYSPSNTVPLKLISKCKARARKFLSRKFQLYFYFSYSNILGAVEEYI